MLLFNLSLAVRAMSVGQLGAMIIIVSKAIAL
jgi:hypothetical protein